jgi:hypothetical protein
MTTRTESKLAQKNLMMRGAVKEFVLHLASIDEIAGCILLAPRPAHAASSGAGAAIFKVIARGALDGFQWHIESSKGTESTARVSDR